MVRVGLGSAAVHNEPIHSKAQIRIPFGKRLGEKSNMVNLTIKGAWRKR
jgi:hypothetical protein